MKISLPPGNMLGHWLRQPISTCEFQVGKMLVFVEYPADEPFDRYLQAAQSKIDEAYIEKPGVLSFAKKVSYDKYPDFWASVETFTLLQDVLVVFSIRFCVADHMIVYEISWNPEFTQQLAYETWDTKGLEALPVPKLPNDHAFIKVERLGAGVYRHIV